MIPHHVYTYIGIPEAAALIDPWLWGQRASITDQTNLENHPAVHFFCLTCAFHVLHPHPAISRHVVARPCGHGRQMVHSDYSPRRTPPRPVGLLVVSRTPSRAYDFRSGERADALSFLSQNNSLELTRLRFKRAAVIFAVIRSVRILPDSGLRYEKSHCVIVFLRNSRSATIARGVPAGTGNRPRSVGARARARGGVGRRSLSRDSRSRPAQLSALCSLSVRATHPHFFLFAYDRRGNALSLNSQFTGGVLKTACVGGPGDFRVRLYQAGWQRSS